MEAVEHVLREEILPWLGDGAEQAIRAAKQQLAVWEGVSSHPPLLLHVTDAQQLSLLPSFHTLETRDHPDRMLCSQLRGAVAARAAGAGAVPSVRANYGCGIFASYLGVTQEFFTDKMPWVQKHLSKEQILALTPDDLIVQGDFIKALATMRYLKERLEGTGVALYPLDLQGVVDLAHLVMGDVFFYELYDDPETIRHLASLCAEALIRGGRAMLEIIEPEKKGWIAHYNSLVMPASHPLKVSEDTTTLLSRVHIEEYAVPPTDVVLKAFGGGYMHYCGKNPYLTEWALERTHWIGLNYGNPEMHDMLDILRRVAQAGKVYYGSIPNADGAPRREHFRRLLGASRDVNGKPRLLLCASCLTAERDAVLEDWMAAGGAV